VETDWRPFFDTVFIIETAELTRPPRRARSKTRSDRPSLTTGVTADDSFAGRDPVLDAIVAAASSTD
jgi:hypothetical protein